MRCPDCNKFVSYGTPEIEVTDEDTDGTTIRAQVRIALTCGDCGTELKEANLEIDQSFEHKCELPDDNEFEIEDYEAEPNDRVQSTDRKGKPIKSMRYMKTFYGADVTFHVKCPVCEETFDVVGSVEEQASSFEERV